MGRIVRAATSGAVREGQEKTDQSRQDKRNAWPVAAGDGANLRKCQPVVMGITSPANLRSDGSWRLINLRGSRRLVGGRSEW